MRSLELRIPPMLVAAMAGLAIWLTDRYAPVLQFDFAARREVATAIALAGCAVAIAGVVSFRRARTTMNPLRPDGASTLVIAGIYRFTRNPMYLGVSLCLFGWALYLGSAMALVWPLVFVAYMNRFQIAPEEIALSARFGAAFETYCARVRRWI
jgi:protein-S-isoprenylcysteine O-methyltransferase Ste14